MLERRQPSPVVTLNRAVAVSRVEGAAAALEILAGIETDPAMQRYHHFHSVLAELQADLGNTSEARRAYERALELATNPRERSFLLRQLAGIDTDRATT